jgi:DNA-binding SARP family transcriptional activator
VLVIPVSFGSVDEMSEQRDSEAAGERLLPGNRPVNGPSAPCYVQPGARMDFRILGPLEVRDGDREVGLRGGKQRALLALLLVNADRTLAIDRIVDELWGEDVPESAPKMVQIYVSRLRKVLPLGTLHTRPPGYALQLESHELDLHRFEQLVAEARASLDAHRAEEASARFRAALELWRGPALAEFASEPFAPAEGARLEERRISALEGRLEADLVLGRHGDLVGELEALIARYPLREGLRRQQMLALYRSGRQAEALAAYQRARRALAEELGIEPSPALRELERQILQQDPSLDVTAPTVAAVGDVSTAPLTALERGDQSGRPAPAEERRTATVLAADVLPDSSPEDPEARRAAQRERRDVVERELESRGAAVQVLGGGAVLGVFGVPSARDDDSLRAVGAALALRAAELAKRVGLATGEVVTGDPFVAGAAVDRALSLRDAALPGEVLAEGRTWRLVRHAAEATRREGAWAIDSVDEEATPLALHLDTPLVGRARELEQITADFERAAVEGRAHLVTIFGAPGIGKTRLAIGCAQRLRDVATPVFGRCRATAQESTYAPLRELLEAIAGGDLEGWIRDRLEPDDDAARAAAWLAAAVGPGSGAGAAGGNGLGRSPSSGAACKRSAAPAGPRRRALGRARLPRSRRVARRAGPRPGARALPRPSRPARPEAAMGRWSAEQHVGAPRHADRAGG